MIHSWLILARAVVLSDHMWGGVGFGRWGGVGVCNMRVAVGFRGFSLVSSHNSIYGSPIRETLLSAVAQLLSPLTWGIEVWVWEGEPAVLPCSHNTNTTDIQWCRKIQEGCQNVATELAPDSSRKKGTEENEFEIFPNASLLISAVNIQNHNGSYQCLSAKHQMVDLLILQPVKSVTVRTSSPVVPVNSSLTLICEVEGGNPAPNISWYKGESKTPLKTETVQTGRRGPYTYNVTASTEMDGQTFVCQASVMGRSMSNQTAINVGVKPITQDRKHLIPDQLGVTDLLPWCLLGVPLAVAVAVFVYRFSSNRTTPQTATNIEVTRDPPIQNPINPDLQGQYASVHFDARPPACPQQVHVTPQVQGVAPDEGVRSQQQGSPQVSGASTAEDDPVVYASINFKASARLAKRNKQTEN